VLCAGIAVLDFLFRVERFPTASTKSPMVEFKITGGGCAANAAIAVARLGGAARFAGPLGDDEHSARILEGLAREGVDVAGIVRLPGTESSVSGIFVDAAGERLLATRRSPGLGRRGPAILEVCSTASKWCLPTITFRRSSLRFARRHGRAAFRWCSTSTSRWTYATR
jgi:sugar/nucleoside kinase (ribokinase family)